MRLGTLEYTLKHTIPTGAFLWELKHKTRRSRLLNIAAWLGNFWDLILGRTEHPRPADGG